MTDDQTKTTNNKNQGMKEQPEPFYQDESFGWAQDKLDVLEAVRKIIWKRLDRNNHKAFLFGSRATGRFKKWSDVDVGIEADKPLDFGLWQKISSDFEMSSLPYTVDVVDFRRVPLEFARRAKKAVVAL